MVVVALILLGLCLGSFVNALVWRVREQSLVVSRQSSVKTKNKRLKAGGKRLATAEFSILRGHSMCPRCRHRLAADDLVPVLSWLALKGKCRYCRKAIAWQYPLVEAATALLFVVSYVFWPATVYGLPAAVSLAFWLVLLTGFMALIVYDLRWFLLPNKIVYPLLAVAVLQVLAAAVLAGSAAVFTSAALGLLVGGGIFYVLFQLSDGRWIGGGDVKLGFLLGLALGGPIQSLLMIFLASLLGTAVTVPLLLTGRVSRQTHIPFGPFLIMAAILAQLFGASLFLWYRTRFLPI